MDTSNTLKHLLQFQLASDALAVLHLPYVLSALNAEALQASAHVQKWTTRINSLLYSKDAGARWAGLCIAQQSSIYSKALMLECAQSWVTVALPLLSVRMSLLLHTTNFTSSFQKNEGIPILKGAVRLLRTVFTNATGVPEFQRQVSTPNVPKFSAALITIVEKKEDEELRVRVRNSFYVSHH